MRRADERSMVDRLFSVIDAVASEAAGEIGLRELARQADLSPATTHRLVSAAVRWGALERTDVGGVQLGLKLWKLGLRYPDAGRIREASVPVLQDLYGLTHQSVQLAVRDGGAALYLQRYAGREQIPEQSALGRRVPLHCTSVGQVLLAFSPIELLLGIASSGPTAFTPRTLTSEQGLRERCERVRREGVVCVVDEFVMGSTSIAAPVRDERDRVVAAVSIVLSSETAPDRRLELAVRMAANSISRGLGWRQPTGQ